MRYLVALFSAVLLAACASAPTQAPSSGGLQITCDTAPVASGPHVECGEAIAAATRAVPPNYGVASAVAFHHGCSAFSSGRPDCTSPLMAWVEIDLAGGPPYRSVIIEVAKGLDGVTTATLVGGSDALP